MRNESNEEYRTPIRVTRLGDSDVSMHTLSNLPTASNEVRKWEMLNQCRLVKLR
jgi:hypothetical protein